MKSFKAVFEIVEDRNCPFYEVGEKFVLTDKVLTCPERKDVCLILVREMTKLLIELFEYRALGTEEEAYERLFDCSGCTGLIKFQLVDPEEVATQAELRDGHLQLDEQSQALYQRIKNYPLIKVFPPERLSEVIASFRLETVYQDSYLLRKGEPNKKLFIILSGEVVVDDNSVVITSLGEGELCGEMSYLGDNVASSSVKARTDVEVISITGEEFGTYVHESAQVQFFMAQLLSRRLAHANSCRASEFDTCMHGKINEMVPAELFQIFHMHQKTGVLSLQLQKGTATVSFREGCIINAQYGSLTNQEAIFAMLAEKEGVYKFTVGLSPQEMKSAEIGDFMMLLMEGVKRVDEVHEG